MPKVRARGEKIRKFILDNVEKNGSDIAAVTSAKFGISRQGSHKHLQKLIADKALVDDGNTRAKKYKLAPHSEFLKEYPLHEALAEDIVWVQDVRPVLEPMSGNALNIWQHGFTEMFNNAIDHSQGTAVVVRIWKTATTTRMTIFDNGVGIFKKIQTVLDLLDERHAIFELAKGKLTTDPRNHSGEGIFFTSRMFDSFTIMSGGVYFKHDFGNPEDWVLEDDAGTKGTAVFLELHNHTARTTKQIFDQFSSGEDYGFNKTVVPVALAKYGTDALVSRSQAKRLLARVELFKTVLFNFKDVESIGQAFADEIFRVFATRHPDMELLPIYANAAVSQMIARVRSGGPG